MRLPEVTSKSIIVATIGTSSSKALMNGTTSNVNKHYSPTQLSATRTSMVRNFQQHCFNLNDFQLLAKKVSSKDLYEYLASGTDDEQTLKENIIAFKRWYLRPRVMRPVGKITTKTNLFGHTVSMPIFCSPAGVHALCHPTEGECATAKAAVKAGIMFGLSQHSTRSIEEVAASVRYRTNANNDNNNHRNDALLFYQAYILKDRHRTESLIRRAVDAGYKGIFITVDSVRFGYREADARNGFSALPPPHRLANYDHVDTSTSNDNSNNKNDSTLSTTANTNTINTTGKLLEETYNSKQEKAWDQNSEQMFDQNVTWDDIAWIKGIAPDLPLVVKGIMTGEDAELAIAAGADGVMVSNHGGRQLDGALATIDALPDVVQAVAGRVPVWLDSGVRRGTDVIKALALGASAVGIGKPLFFALAVGGESAVSYMLQLLQTEIEAAMAICGIERIEDITPNLVTRHPTHYHSDTRTYLKSSL